MIRGFRRSGNQMVSAADTRDWASLDWVDLEVPSAAEIQEIETALGLEVPNREEMEEIEPSSRIYHENGVFYMTAQIVHVDAAKGRYEIAPVTFMIQEKRLVTLHHQHLEGFVSAKEWGLRGDSDFQSGVQSMLDILDYFVDRLADLIEAESREHSILSQNIFFKDHHGDGDLDSLISSIGRAEEHNARLAESLSNVNRLISYLTLPGGRTQREALNLINREQLRALAQDVASLLKVTRVQAEKVRFLLDATLGVINIRQSDVIKIFSVVAVVFLPPTLIASIYGMNFEVMPELSWRFGYPLALLTMVVSAVLPWALFRWKKWL